MSPLHAAAHDEEVWDNLWRRSNRLPARDVLTELLYEHLAMVVGSLHGKRIIEMGSGSGRISAQLATAGAQVFLMDNSEPALALSRRFVPSPARLIMAEIPQFPFRPGTFDVMWSSGVMEHWSRTEQALVFKECARLCRPGGWFIAFNPFARSLFYRLGKRALELLRAWPYGDEHPVETLADVAGTEWRVEREYSLAFIAIPANAFRLLHLTGVDIVIQALGVRALDGRRAGRIVRATDRVLSRLLGGYLLLSVFRRDSDESS